MIVAVLVLQVGFWFAMVTSLEYWLGSWRGAIEQAAGAVEIAGPLLAGLAAQTYAGLRRTAIPDLVIASVRPTRGWLAPAFRLWIASVISLGMVMIAVTVRSRILDAPTPGRQFLIVPVCVLMLAVHALIGMVIGLRAGPRVAGVLAAFTSFCLFLLATEHLAPPSFITGGATGGMIGEQYRWAAVIALCGFAAASALAVAPWVLWTTQWARQRWLISIVAGLCIAGLGHVTWPDVEGRLEPAALVPYRCGGAVPQVCAPTERVADDLGRISRRLGELATPLRDAGALLPAKWSWMIPGRRPLDGGSLLISVEAELGGRVGDKELIRSLIDPAACPEYTSNREPTESFSARVLLLNWISIRNGFGRSSKKLAAVLEAENFEGWVRTTYAQLRTCDLDAVRKP